VSADTLDLLLQKNYVIPFAAACGKVLRIRRFLAIGV
jgi:hypothetical protein